MTLIKPKPILKIVPLPVTADLSPTSLSIAATLAQGYPHDGIGDLVVHASAMAGATRTATVHNGKSSALKVHVLTDPTLGHADWKLRTKGVIVASIWTSKTG